jgi:hypothetical protein
MTDDESTPELLDPVGSGYIAEPPWDPYADMSDCNLCCSWIAPDGKASHLNSLGPGSGSHCGVADKLGDPSGGRDLDKRGYMHVSFGDPFFLSEANKPTQAQLDTLFDIGKELNRRGSRRGEYIQRYLDEQLTKETA